MDKFEQMMEEMAKMPKAEMMNPAMIAVIIPFSGAAPDAIAKAIASGKATMPTIIPAIAWAWFIRSTPTPT